MRTGRNSVSVFNARWEEYCQEDVWTRAWDYDVDMLREDGLDKESADDEEGDEDEE